VPLSTFRIELPDSVKQLSIVDTAAFSAATVPIENGRRVIIYNDGHDPGRQNNSIAHEIAHILLGHPSTLPIDSSGKRVIDRDIEDEANWLGATILISDEAALRIVRDGLSTREACDRYGVSAPLLQMRRNASGAVIRARRASAH
jgi:Zn-dependent peptidase ImmA (M78 family)